MKLWLLAVFIIFVAAVAVSYAQVTGFDGRLLMSSSGATASLVASPSTIASGSSSTLTWSSTGAVSCTSPGSLGNTAIPSFTGATSGSVSTGALTTTTTYSIQCGTATTATSAATVTISGGGGGIACTIGPNFTGTVPAPAVRAGFNTCFENLDIATSFGNTMSNWLDCFGGNLWFNTGYNSNVTPPCGDYTIVSDTVNGISQTVLDIAYTAANAANGQNGTWMQTCLNTSSCTTPGQFPVNSYADIVFELLPADPPTNVFSTYTGQTVCVSMSHTGAPNCSVYTELLDWFGLVIQTQFMEVDGVEVTAGGTSGTAGQAYSGAGAPFPGLQYGQTTTTYNNYGTLTTADGAGDWWSCAFLNVSSSNPHGTINGCHNIAQGSGLATGTKYAFWGTGPSGGNTMCYFGCSGVDGGCNPNLVSGRPICPALSQTLHARIAAIHVFTCSSYASGQCINSPPITTP